MGRVYKRPGREGWWIDFVGADGERRRTYGAHSKEVAQRILRHKEDEVQLEREFGGSESAVKPIKISEYAKTHLETYSIGLDSYKDDVYIWQILRPVIEDKLMHRIETEELAVALMSFKGKVSNSRINRYRTFLHCLFNQAKTHKRVRSNPVSAIPKLEEPKPKKVYATPVQVSALLANSPWWFKEIIALAILTGLREGALLSIKVENIDLETGIIYIDRDKDGAKYVSLTPQAVEVVRHILSKRRPKSCPYLFFLPPRKRQDGHYVSSDWNDVTESSGWRRLRAGSGVGTFYRTWHAARAASDLPDFKFAYFRHTHASWLALLGSDMKAIAEQLGHSSVAVTEKHYAHLSKAYRNEQINRIDSAFAFGTHLAPEPLKVLEFSDSDDQKRVENSD